MRKQKVWIGFEGKCTLVKLLAAQQGFDDLIIDLEDAWQFAQNPRERYLTGSWNTPESRGTVTLTLAKRYQACTSLKQLKFMCDVISPVTEEEELLFRRKKYWHDWDRFCCLHKTLKGNYA